MAKSKGYSVDHFGFLATQVLRSIGDRVGIPLPEATITEDSFWSQSALDAIRDAATRAVRKTGTGALHYNDYQVGSRNLYSTFDYDGGWGDFFRQVKDIAKSVEAPSAVQGIIGQAAVYVDNNNNLMVVDDYDYHVQESTPGRLVDKVHKLFEPGQIFSVSEENTRKVLLNLGPAPKDVAARLRGIGRVLPSPAETIASTKTSQELYSGGFLDATYNSIKNIFETKGELKTEDVPLEFIALAREKLNNFFQVNPESSVVSFDELEMPDMPDVMQYVAAEKKDDGGYNLFDKFKLFAEEAGNQVADLLDIDVSIPAFDRLAGNIPDVPVNMVTAKPTFPTAILSNDRLAMMQTAIKETLYNKPDDEMSFSEAFAANRKGGAAEFMWRGDKYTTRYLEEDNGNQA